MLPVRRLLRATERVRGGTRRRRAARRVKELDTLAVSFNQCRPLYAAQELARQYHGQLGRKSKSARGRCSTSPPTPADSPADRRQFLVSCMILSRARPTRNARRRLLPRPRQFQERQRQHGPCVRRPPSAVGLRTGCVLPCAISATAAARRRRIHRRVRAGTRDAEIGAGVAAGAGFPGAAHRRRPRLVMGLSLGASVFPIHGREPEGLLRAADAALFHAKAQGRSRVRIFSPELLEAAAAKFATEQGLRRAVDRGEFELHFQPEVDLATCEVGVVEALLRWRLPDGSLRLALRLPSGRRGLLPDPRDRRMGHPSTVEHGRALARRRLAPRTHCRHVSALQLLDSRFVQASGRARSHHLSPQCIEVELTVMCCRPGGTRLRSLARCCANSASASRSTTSGPATRLSCRCSNCRSPRETRSQPNRNDRHQRALASRHARSSRSARASGSRVIAEGSAARSLAWLLCYPAMHVQGYLLCRPVPEADLLTALNAMPARIEELLRKHCPQMPAAAGMRTSKVRQFPLTPPLRNRRGS